MEETRKHLEIQKLAHILHTEQEKLDFLNSHSYESLSFLREKVNDAIFQEQSEIWEPLAKVTRFMPNFINAKVSEEILGPHITANITYHVSTKDAISISNFFSIKFFGDVMELVNPERVQEVIKQSPYSKIRQIFKELQKRKNYYIIGNLMDSTPVPVVEKIIGEVGNEEEVVYIAEYASKKHRLVPALENYKDDYLKKLILKSIELEKPHVFLEYIVEADNAKSFYQRVARLLDGLDTDKKQAFIDIAKKMELV